MIRPLQKAMAPVRRGLRLIASRAVILLTDDAPKTPTAQVRILADEVRDGVEHFQHYGFTSRPLPKCEAIVLALGGDRSHAVIIASGDRRYRLQGLEEGEVALYTDEGDKIVMKRGNTIEIHTDELHVHGKLIVHGQAEATEFTAGSISLTSHAHSATQPGGGFSGGPVPGA